MSLPISWLARRQQLIAGDAGDGDTLKQFRNKTEVWNRTPRFELEWMSFGFFKIGLMIADPSLLGKISSENETLIIVVKTGESSSLHSFTIHTGTISRLHCLCGARPMKSETSSAEHGEKFWKEGMHLVEMSGGAQCSVPARIASIFPSKKLAKLAAVWGHAHAPSGFNMDCKFLHSAFESELSLIKLE